MAGLTAEHNDCVWNDLSNQLSVTIVVTCALTSCTTRETASQGLVSYATSICFRLIKKFEKDAFSRHFAHLDLSLILAKLTLCLQLLSHELCTALLPHEGIRNLNGCQANERARGKNGA